MERERSYVRSQEKGAYPALKSLQPQQNTKFLLKKSNDSSLG
jgi:hypothetical protein